MDRCAVEWGVFFLLKMVPEYICWGRTVLKKNRAKEFFLSVERGGGGDFLTVFNHYFFIVSRFFLLTVSNH